MIDIENMKALAAHLRSQEAVDAKPREIEMFTDEAAAAIESLLSELEAAQRERDELRAARIAYASEFDTDEEGMPDTGNIHANIRKLKAELEAREADRVGSVRSWTREDVQNKALEHGLRYWRAPDAHGVEGTKQQTIDLLQDLLGVEVEIKDATQDQPWEIAGIDVPDDEREVMVFLNGDCALCDWDGRKGGGWGIRLGFYDHDKRYWRVHGCREEFVTHWKDLPDGPETAVKDIAALAQRQEGEDDDRPRNS